MASHNRKGRSKGGPSFVQLFRFVKRSEAWHDLSPHARCALIELLDRFTGINNGMISLSVRELARHLQCAPGTANKALQELDDSGLARPATVGRWRGKQATVWRLTFYRDDRTGEPGQRNWPAAVYQQVTQQSAARDTQESREAACVSTDEQKTRKTQQTGSACVSPVGTLLQSTRRGCEGESVPGDGDTASGNTARQSETNGHAMPDLSIPAFLDRQTRAS